MKVIFEVAEEEGDCWLKQIKPWHQSDGQYVAHLSEWNKQTQQVKTGQTCFSRNLQKKKKKERKKINAPRINVIKLSAHECSAGIETLKAGTRFYSNIKET